MTNEKKNIKKTKSIIFNEYFNNIITMEMTLVDRIKKKNIIIFIKLNVMRASVNSNVNASRSKVRCEKAAMR